MFFIYLFIPNFAELVEFAAAEQLPPYLRSLKNRHGTNRASPERRSRDPRRAEVDHARVDDAPSTTTVSPGVAHALGRDDGVPGDPTEMPRERGRSVDPPRSASSGAAPEVSGESCLLIKEGQSA